VEEEKEKYFVLNEYGKFEYLGLFVDFDEADDFASGDGWSGISVWIFNEDDYEGLRSSLLTVGKIVDA